MRVGAGGSGRGARAGGARASRRAVRAGKNILGGFVRTPVRAGAHRENIFYFFTVYFLRAFSHAFWRTEDGGRTEEDAVFVRSTGGKAQVRLRSASPS